MNTIRIRKQLQSDRLPELKPLIGKTVEITIECLTNATDTATQAEWDAAMQAAHELDDYDYDAVQRGRDYDLLHAKDHLP